MSLVSDLKKWFTNAKPGKDELAKRLEQEHKTLFLYLVDATNYYLNLQKLNAAGKLTPAQNAAMKNYLAKGIVVADKWKKQQKELEGLGVPKFTPTFFNLSAQKEINDKAKKIREKLNGVGFLPAIPLIWFGVVAVASWTTVKITDMLTTTTQEQESLMNTTQKMCADLKLSPEACREMLNENMKATDNSILPKGSGLLLPLGLLAAVIFFLNEKSS